MAQQRAHLKEVEVLKSCPKGCRSDRSYVSRLSKGNGTAVAA